MNFQLSRKKIIFSILFLALIGLAFFIWTRFFAKSSILVTAKSPYTLTLYKITNKNPDPSTQKPDVTLNCENNDCLVQVSSGNYELILTKENYRNVHLNVTVASNSQQQQKVQFQFIPMISKVFDFPQTANALLEKSHPQISLNAWKNTPPEFKNFPSKANDILFAPDGKTAITYEKNAVSIYNIKEGTLKKLDISPTTVFFYAPDGKALYYLDQSKETSRQTLYQLKINEDGTTQKAVIITSFLRDLQKYFLKISPSGDKIILVDQMDQQSSLYLLNTVKKERLSILNYPFIGDVKWFPDSNSFLFEAQTSTTAEKTLNIYHLDTQLDIPLQIPISSLHNIVPIDENHLLITLMQNFPLATLPDDLEGKNLELQSAASVLLQKQNSANQTKDFPIFIDYTLATQKAELLKIIPGNIVPNTLELINKATLYYADKNTVWEFHFGEENN